MTYETLYLIVNAGVMPAWALLILAPKSDLTKKLVHSGVYPITYGLLYAIFLGLSLFGGFSSEEAGMSSLAGVMALFDHPNGVLTGWVHYLVFDLFVGAWIGRDALRKSIAHWKTVPVLVLTLMFGPIGLLGYFALRHFSGHRRLELNETG